MYPETMRIRFLTQCSVVNLLESFRSSALCNWINLDQNGLNFQLHPTSPQPLPTNDCAYTFLQQKPHILAIYYVVHTKNFRLMQQPPQHTLISPLILLETNVGNLILTFIFNVILLPRHFQQNWLPTGLSWSTISLIFSIPPSSYHCTTKSG